METVSGKLRSRLLLCLPPLLLGVCLLLWTVDVLNWDEWVIWTGLLEHLRDGSLSLLDIIRQQNEQRNAAARLIGLAFFPIFRGNRFPEYATIMLMACGCALLAAKLYRLTMPEPRDRRPLYVFSALAFSLLQWETFTFGINTSVLSPVLGLWAGVCLAWWTERLGLWRFGAMAACGVVSSFSFANGLFFWPCLAPLVALRAGSRRRAQVLTGLWLAIGALVWGLYFLHYAKPEHHPSPLLALRTPVALAGYFLAYLGGALVGDRNLLPVAILAGAFGLFLLVVVTRAAWRAGPESRARLWPWLAVAGFTLLSALATAVGRCGISLGQALESRYATFTSPLWMVLAALFAANRLRLGETLRRWCERGAALCVCLFLLSTVLAAIVLHNRYPRLEQAREELFRLTDPEALRVIFPDPAFVLARMPLFLECRAGIYRDVLPLGAYGSGAPVTGTVTAVPLDLVEGRVHGFLVQGTVPGRTEGELLVRAGDRVAGLGKIDPDGSWRLFVPESALPAGNVTLTVDLVPEEGTQLRPVGPAAGVALNNPGRVTREFHLARNFFVPGLTHAANGKPLCGP